MEQRHFSHSHGLVFHQMPQGSEIQCSGCKNPGSGNVYVCWPCNYFLHEQCFRAARFLDHPSHPLHPLTLVPYPTYPSASFFCETCKLIGNGFSYCCSECDFDLHVHCALLHNNSYPNPHSTPSPLPFPMPNNNADINFNQNPIYPPIQNNTFPTYPPPPQPHNSTYPPTTNIPFPAYPHPQNDAQNHVPQPQNPTSTYPPTPNNTSPNVPTQNYGHVSQPTPQPPSSSAPLGYPQQTPLGYPQQTNAPVTTESTVVSTTNTTMPTTNNPPSVIKHFSHPHVLKAMEIDQKSGKVCSACECALTGPSYICTDSQCKFSLHKPCFDSPLEVRHKSHLQHPLKLLTAPPYPDGFTCNACLKDGKAFVYTCSGCSFDLHVDCVNWPDKVTRSDHKHSLTLYYSSPAVETSQEVTFMCDVCKNPVHEMAWIYYCRECDFGTHLECVASAVKEDSSTSSSGAGAKSDEELLRETELRLAMLQILLGGQGYAAAANLVG